ncbi:MAG: cytochrome b/b6 domain-containing protein [Silicimonas sp.]|jgi:cytochrome b561|nr:cytochrome b/b6 domain-containing protein [Silicimonas sp.]
MASMRTGYSGLQIALHWIVAVLIFGAWLTHDGMGRALRQRIEQDLSGFEGATLHTLLGGTVFALVLIRLIVRLKRGAPEPHGSPAIQMAATWGHRLLYALMILVPALGAATWYGKIEGLGEVHELAGNALMLVAIGHLLMALVHQALWSDGTLSRMFAASRE